MKKTAIFASLLLLIAASSFAASNIVIVNLNAPGVGFNDPTPVVPVGGNTGTTLGQQRLNAFQYAADIWGATLDSKVQIRIQAQFASQTCTATSATLGSAGATTVHRDFAEAPLPATWYSGALASKLTGRDMNPTGNHINATFNANLNGNPACLGGRKWYLGFDGNKGTDIDLVAVLLHEFGHGLGFQTFTTLGTGAQFNGFTDMYARNLLNASTSKTYPQMTNAERVAASTNSRNLVWVGSHVTEAVPEVLALGVPLLTVTSPASVAGKYAVGLAAFGAPLSSPGVSGSVVLGLDASDAAGPSTTDGCSPLTNASAVAGKIAVLDRGTCGFAVKAKNAQDAGAIGVIIADNAAGSPPADMAGVDESISIPSVRVTLNDGIALKAALSGGVHATMGLDLSARAGAHPLLQMAQMFAPSPSQAGSSVSHYDTIAFPNQLMEPSINVDLTQSVKPPQDMTLPLMRDIGWYPDADLDMVSDAGDDQCLGSDLGATIAIGSCETGIANIFSSATGCSRSDLIAKIAAASSNHGGFVSGVTSLANEWKKTGEITGREYSTIISCTAGSALP